MIFTKTMLAGVYLIDLEKLEDERGFFARTFCQREFEAHRLNASFVQRSISFNRKKGTLRGMHYQSAPYLETKLVQCTRGAIYDVVIDIRPNSPTFTRWLSTELTADSRRMLYIPEGFAHGFQTLLDESEVFYQISEFYQPEAARGIRWDDPAFNIAWPLDELTISARDRSFAAFPG